MFRIEGTTEFRVGDFVTTVVFDPDAIPVGFGKGSGGSTDGGAVENAADLVSKRHFQVLKMSVVCRERDETGGDGIQSEMVKAESNPDKRLSQCL